MNARQPARLRSSLDYIDARQVIGSLGQKLVLSCVHHGLRFPKYACISSNLLSIVSKACVAVALPRKPKDNSIARMLPNKSDPVIMTVGALPNVPTRLDGGDSVLQECIAAIPPGQSSCSVVASLLLPNIILCC